MAMAIRIIVWNSLVWRFACLRSLGNHLSGTTHGLMPHVHVPGRHSPPLMARPRKYDSDQARIAASRHRQAEAGAQLLQVRLTPPAFDALLRIIAGTGETKSAAVSRLLVEASTAK